MEHVNITPKSMDAEAGAASGHAGIIEKTAVLSPGQKAAVRGLVGICRAKDDIRLSYPMEPDMAECHYLLWRSQDRQLMSVLAFVPCDETEVECIAFTHPQYRNLGYFSRLLEQAEEEYEDIDILFPVSGSCEDTLAALHALGAEPESREYQMELELEPEKYGEAAEGFLTDTVVLDFYPCHGACAAAGTLQATPVSEHGACLHHVEIYPEFRGKGLGEQMVRLMLKKLAACNVRTVVLQVSADNLPALRLYEKTGFRITETLSYYLY